MHRRQGELARVSDRRAGIEQLLYIDPDVLVTNGLDQIFARLEVSDIVLTSHTNVDYPDDGPKPRRQLVMTYGVFNLGFIGVNASENARTFLRWWQTKVRDKCVSDARRAISWTKSLSTWCPPV